MSLYFTLGQYDFLVISEMPDAKAASVLAFVATGGGIEGSVTTQAFTTAEARDMLAAAGGIAGDYKPMGATQSRLGKQAEPALEAGHFLARQRSLASVCANMTY